MAITADTLLQAAQEMAAGTREVDWRSAASRAYYAAYHRCIPFAYGRASASPGHMQMIADLTHRNAEPSSRRAGFLLRHCKELREQADYELEATFQRADADSALQSTGRIFDIVRAA